MQQLKPSTSYNNYKDFPDLYIVSVGREGENPKHSFGPVVFHSYAFQYLVYGQGKYTVDGKTYDIRRGDMMLIPKDCVVKYEADPENPYSYFWVCFDGNMADKLLDLTALSLSTPVVSYNNDSLAFSMDNIVRNVHLNNMPASVAATGELYKLFSLLAKKCTACEQSTNNVRSEYILESMLYMHENFARDHHRRSSAACRLKPHLFFHPIQKASDRHPDRLSQRLPHRRSGKNAERNQSVDFRNRQTHGI